MRQVTALLLLLTAIVAFVAIRPPEEAVASTSGPGAVVDRVSTMRCKTDGVKDTHVEIYNPATSAVTITVKVASTTGFGTPVEYTMSPMGLRRIDCNAASQLYGGSVKRAVVVVSSEYDVRVGGLYVSKYKSLPVPLQSDAGLNPTE